MTVRTVDYHKIGVLKMNTIKKPQRAGRGSRNGYGSSFSDSNYSIKSPVYRGDGKVIGFILDGTLSKSVSSEKHMLQKPRGWAWDEEILIQAEKEGASKVEIQDRKSGKTYYSTIRDFWDFGIGFNRGWGEQIVLPLQYWDVQNPGEPRVEQLAFPV